MDKPDLIERLAESNPRLKTKDAELAVKVILDALCGTLVKGDRIEIRGFGSFSLRICPPEQKPNPRNGGNMKSPVKYIPQFKPAKELRERTGDCAGAETAAVMQALGIHTLSTATQIPLNSAVIRNIEKTGNHV